MLFYFENCYIGHPNNQSGCCITFITCYTIGLVIDSRAYPKSISKKLYIICHIVYVTCTTCYVTCIQGINNQLSSIKFLYNCYMVYVATDWTVLHLMLYNIISIYLSSVRFNLAWLVT